MKLRTLITVSLAAAGVPALAQDPPARVGRLAYAAGPVSFAPAGTETWAQAPLNRPVIAGDRLWTGTGARDELQFGSVVARMDGASYLTLLAADERATQFQLTQGRLLLHVRRADPGAVVEVDTPNLAFVVQQPGDYRVEVAPDGTATAVEVKRGAAQAYGDGTSYRIGPGEAYRFDGQDLNNYAQLQDAPPDDFDRWATQRDARFERAQSARYVPAGVVGYEDLDDYGSWRSVPQYGNVWIPTRAPRNWAPYHDGHWSWIDPWGWTWVDDQPWGYAVSHYGRWTRLSNDWAWVPAPARTEPVYAPALVAFVGAALGGRSADPGVGWFPLAPREVYRPPYRASPTYVTRVNVSNTVVNQVNITNVVNNFNNVTYVNRTVPGAVAAMPTSAFVRAGQANRHAVVLPQQVAALAPVVAAPRAQPLAESRIGTPPARNHPPEDLARRMTLARTAPVLALAGAHAVQPAVRVLQPAPMAAQTPPSLRAAAQAQAAARGRPQPVAPGAPMGRPALPGQQVGAVPPGLLRTMPGQPLPGQPGGHTVVPGLIGRGVPVPAQGGDLSRVAQQQPSAAVPAPVLTGHARGMVPDLAGVHAVGRSVAQATQAGGADDPRSVPAQQARIAVERAAVAAHQAQAARAAEADRMQAQRAAQQVQAAQIQQAEAARAHAAQAQQAEAARVQAAQAQQAQAARAHAVQDQKAEAARARAVQAQQEEAARAHAAQGQQAEAARTHAAQAQQAEAARARAAQAQQAEAARAHAAQAQQAEAARAQQAEAARAHAAQARQEEAARAHAVQAERQAEAARAHAVQAQQAAAAQTRDARAHAAAQPHAEPAADKQHPGKSTEEHGQHKKE